MTLSVYHNRENPAERATAERVNREASDWLKRGLALLEQNTQANLIEAIRYFDRAIRLRSQLPLELDPMYRYGLAAGWMNRGDALTRLGSLTNLTEAVQAYDEALVQLGSLPLDTDPRFRRRLAIAWQNRGLALQVQNCAAAAFEAGQSFEAAMITLQNDKAGAITDRNFLLAAIWMHHGNLLVAGKSKESAEQAHTAASRALALVAPLEAEEATAAEAGLKARNLSCQAIAQLLTVKAQTDANIETLLTEAAGLVQTGLALARRWEERGANQFQALAWGLFHQGTRVYHEYQASFLTEFLVANLNPAHLSATVSARSEIQAAALEVLWANFRELQHRGGKSPDARQMAALEQKLRNLQIGGDQLAGLIPQQSR